MRKFSEGESTKLFRVILPLFSSATLLVAGTQTQPARRSQIFEPRLSQSHARVNAETDAGPSRVLVCQNLPMAAGGAISSADIQELQERVALGKLRQPEMDAQARQQEHQREFATKFNLLVEAVRSFASQYNRGQGEVWPLREAAKLRRAMHQLQQLEKTLRDDPKSAPDSN